MYGGTCSGAEDVVDDHGLSPRVRGNRVESALEAVGEGSIPACTGEPRTVTPCARRRGVYPRVYGGTNVSLIVTIPKKGLSPRVRGNLPSARPPGHKGRSIPACTGEPATAGASAGRTRVYPRVYGGTHVIVSGRLRILGLSPRVRGNQC